MSLQITRQQAEQILHNRFYNKVVSFSYPGYTIVYGKVDEIAIEGAEVIIQINKKRYTCSPESLKECLKLQT